MCGISFFCSRHGAFVDELSESLKVISHRGPDARGFLHESFGQYSIGIGHNRLSIMDLTETGSQPMISGSGNVLSYNGEIYNHVILRQELEFLGHQFIGNSDTEVILRLYDEFGSKSFGMLRGMFSFVVLDKKSGRLFVVRDAVGIKPVYLFQENGELYGCSEIKGLKAFEAVKTDIDEDDVYEFFNNGFLYEPSTGFKFIKKLMPGYFAELDLTSGHFSLECYKDVTEFHESGNLTDKLNRAIKDQQVADVPLGVFFSGGADSSILASHFNSTELFFAKYGSDPAADIDLKYSKLIAEFLGKELNIAELDSNDQDVETLLDSVEFVAANSEELISDYTFWATYQLSNAAKDSGYKVMLSGMGGDEAFAGYPRYIVLKYHLLVKIFSPLLSLLLKFRLFPKKLNKKFERLVSYSSEKNWGIAYSRMLGYFSHDELSMLFNESNKENLNNRFSAKINKVLSKYKGSKKDKVKLAQFMDATGFLSHNLMVSDKASMLASIELRVPLLDEAIVAHGFNLKANQLIHKRQTKFPLKSILKKILPDRLVERPKTGFNPPLDGLVNKIGEKRFKQELATLEGVINIDKITQLIEEHFQNVSNNTYKLWQLLYFSRWLKINA